MKSWTELHIAVVYYSGLLISVLIGITALLYLKPLFHIKKIMEGSGTLWAYNFITTVLIAGLLGAMSVYFSDCHGDYDHLLNSPSTTLFYGRMQISTANMAYAIILSIWFVILIVLQMVRVRKLNIPFLYKIICVALLGVGIFLFYDFR